MYKEIWHGHLAAMIYIKLPKVINNVLGVKPRRNKNILFFGFLKNSKWQALLMNEEHVGPGGEKTRLLSCMQTINVHTILHIHSVWSAPFLFTVYYLKYNSLTCYFKTLNILSSL